MRDWDWIWLWSAYSFTWGNQKMVLYFCVPSVYDDCVIPILARERGRKKCTQSFQTNTRPWFNPRYSGTTAELDPVCRVDHCKAKHGLLPANNPVTGGGGKCTIECPQITQLVTWHVWTASLNGQGTLGPRSRSAFRTTATRFLLGGWLEVGAGWAAGAGMPSRDSNSFCPRSLLHVTHWWGFIWIGTSAGVCHAPDVWASLLSMGAVGQCKA